MQKRGKGDRKLHSRCEVEFVNSITDPGEESLDLTYEAKSVSPPVTEPLIVGRV